MNSPKQCRLKRRLENSALDQAKGIKRVKLKSRKFYVRELDKYWGDIARGLYKKSLGDWCCFCDIRGVPKQLINQAFHFLSRGHYSTRWDIQNLWASCAGCNIAFEHQADFVHKVIEWYKNNFGKEHWEALVKRHHEPAKFTRSDLAAMLEQLKSSHTETQGGIQNV
jgi:hypothetical protein